MKAKRVTINIEMMAEAYEVLVLMAEEAHTTPESFLEELVGNMIEKNGIDGLSGPPTGHGNN